MSDLTHDSQTVSGKTKERGYTATKDIPPADYDKLTHKRAHPELRAANLRPFGTD